jgi:hypothetical protein
MSRKKRPANASQVEEQGKRQDEPRSEYVLSEILADATLRLPLDEEMKVLQIEKLKMDLARSQERQHGNDRSPWYNSNPEIIKRRQIVLKNSKMVHKSLCKLFDHERIAVPPDWEKQKWVEAYADKNLRQRIHKIISTDKREGAAEG